jgi:hypothetical protein
MTETVTGMSSKILARLLIAIVALLGIIAANYEFLSNLYFNKQLTLVGWTINGAILILFIVGIFRIALMLMRYAREESQLKKFVIHAEDGHEDLLKGLSNKSLVHQRYSAITHLSNQYANIDHAALASALVARESTRLSFPRFVHNILILMGVLGTIISLSIALMGASNLINVTEGIGGDMGLVIHGMSTAMSTTMTAIVCYLFYGYFFIKLTDVQTQVFASLEQVTTMFMLPQFAGSEDNVMAEVGKLLGSLSEVAREMQHAQVNYSEAGSQLRDIVGKLGSDLNVMTRDMEEMKKILREGFRLPGDNNRP